MRVSVREKKMSEISISSEKIRYSVTVVSTNSKLFMHDRTKYLIHKFAEHCLLSGDISYIWVCRGDLIIHFRKPCPQMPHSQQCLESNSIPRRAWFRGLKWMLDLIRPFSRTNRNTVGILLF